MIMLAAGGNVEAYWNVYRQHYKDSVTLLTISKLPTLLTLATNTTKTTSTTKTALNTTSTECDIHLVSR